MHLDSYVDLLIPRGGAGLINAVAAGKAPFPLLRREPGTATFTLMKQPTAGWP